MLAQGTTMAPEMPCEPRRGCIVLLAGALTLIRHVVLARDEVRRPDRFASMLMQTTRTGHRLAAIPFERLPGDCLRCSVTGVAIRQSR